jgi:hypothetical protein
MKRLFALVAVVGLVIALPLAHLAQADVADKVDICHIISANDTYSVAGFGTFYFGKVLNINASAVPAHERHGDSTDFTPVDPDFLAFLEESEGLSFPTADCAIFVPAIPAP